MKREATDLSSTSLPTLGVPPFRFVALAEVVHVLSRVTSHAPLIPHPLLVPCGLSPYTSNHSSLWALSSLLNYDTNPEYQEVKGRSSF